MAEANNIEFTLEELQARHALFEPFHGQLDELHTLVVTEIAEKNALTLEISELASRKEQDQKRFGEIQVEIEQLEKSIQLNQEKE